LGHTSNPLWGWRPLNGRPGLHMAVRRRPKSEGDNLAYGL